MLQPIEREDGELLLRQIGRGRGGEPGTGQSRIFVHNQDGQRQELSIQAIRLDWFQHPAQSPWRGLVEPFPPSRSPERAFLCGNKSTVSIMAFPFETSQQALSSLSVDGIEIRQDAEGRFSLNDLHKASGGLKRHSPNYWLENQQTQELIEEIRKSLNSGDT